MNHLFTDKRALFVLLLPGLLFFLAGIVVPLLVSGMFSVTDFPGYGPLRFVGAENFIRIMFQDDVFWGALFHAVLLGVGYIVVQHPLCILVSFGIDRMSGGWERFFRTALFIPSVLSVVVTVRLWVQMLNPLFGLVNTVLAKIGLESLQHAWLGDTATALPSVLIMSIWIGFGFGFLFYYAGVKGIDRQLYEAAQIDGAGVWRQLRHITIPQLRPIIRVNIILAMINALKQMEIVYLSTDGGPGNSTQFIANYLYRKAFVSSEYGYANAISLLFAIICIAVTVLMGRMFRNES